MNPEAGVIVVRATSRQHEKVQEYLDLVLTNARRQVMIEATIAEVELKDTYAQGINWQSLRTLRTENNPRGGFSMIQNPAGPIFPTTAGAAFLLNYVAPGLGISATLSLLETFGNVKVLSSPKMSVLNNQTAMLKVVDNIVYFLIKNDSTTTTTGTTNNFTSTPQSVSVGLVMSVTPQISENGSILLNVRPTISSIKGGDGVGKEDPTPGLLVKNIVPEIKTREMESMLRLTDGEIAVMGGLMSDELSQNTTAVPGLSKLPGVGTLFTSRSDGVTRKELVIFLKPTIIRDPSIDGDYRSFRRQLPSKDFFANNPGPEPKQIEMPGAGPQ